MLYHAGVGGSKLALASDHDTVALVGAGVTLHACLQAAELLARDGIAARVIELLLAQADRPRDA